MHLSGKDLSGLFTKAYHPQAFQKEAPPLPTPVHGSSRQSSLLTSRESLLPKDRCDCLIMRGRRKGFPVTFKTAPASSGW